MSCKIMASKLHHVFALETKLLEDHEASDVRAQDNVTAYINALSDEIPRD